MHTIHIIYWVGLEIFCSVRGMATKDKLRNMLSCFALFFPASKTLLSNRIMSNSGCW